MIIAVGSINREALSLAGQKEIGNSRIVYLQFGDGPSAYVNPFYRRLIANAIKWVSLKNRSFEFSFASKIKILLMTQKKNLN